MRKKARLPILQTPSITEAADPAAGMPLPKLAPWMIGALLFLWSILVYIPIYNGGFLWDDDQGVTASALVQDPEGLPKIWFNPPKPHADYFPLTTTSFWIEWKLWKANASGYHVVNVLLHGLSVVMLWRLLKELGIPGAWVAALIFGVHPVNAESVSWISERKNMLTLVFALPAFMWFVRFDRDGNRKWYILALISFLLALLAKTSTVTLPVMLLLYVWWQRGKLPGVRDWLHTAPFFALSIILGLVTIHFQHSRAIGVEDIPIGDYPSRLAGMGLAFWFYLSKALLPVNLMTIYPKWDYDPAQLWQAFPVLAIVALFFFCWRHRETWGRHVGFGMGCYLLALLPALGLIKMSYMRLTLVADHFQHLALPAVIALVVPAALGWFRRRGGEWVPFGMAAGAFVVGAFSVMTWDRAYIHRNEDLMWTDNLLKNADNWQANNRLGALRAQQGRLAEAMAHFEAGVRANPVNAEVHNNVAVMLANQGKLDEAVAKYREALKYRQDIIATHANLAKALAMLNRFDEAAAALDYGISKNSDNPEMYKEAGFLMANTGRLDKAVELLRKALAMSPKDFQAMSNLGAALVRTGQLDEAIALFQEALRLHPGFGPAKDNLAKAIELKTGTKPQPGTPAPIPNPIPNTPPNPAPR